jgi:hypothetical protein
MIRDDDAEVLERAPVGVVAFANQSMNAEYSTGASVHDHR